MQKKSEKPGIIFIEDHPVMRNRLAAWFKETGRWQVLGAASTLIEGKDLLTAVPQNSSFPLVLLLDIQLENGWSFDIIPFIRDSISLKPVIAIYSAFDDYAHVKAALAFGVKAYITKRRSESELEAALLEALNGTLYIDESAQMRLKIMKDFLAFLTRREIEILGLIKEGLTNKQIAARLNISFRTVENIVSCIYDKTGVRTRLELGRL